jgi:hypothetical protein
MVPLLVSEICAIHRIIPDQFGLAADIFPRRKGVKKGWQIASIKRWYFEIARTVVKVAAGKPTSHFGSGRDTPHVRHLKTKEGEKKISQNQPCNNRTPKGKGVGHQLSHGLSEERNRLFGLFLPPNLLRCSPPFPCLPC